MNETSHIYESISCAALNKAVQITLSLVMSLSLITHIYMYFVLHKSMICSCYIKLLLYLQCTIEGLFSIMVIVQTNTNNFTPVSNRVPVNPILCYLFQSGALSTIFRVLLYCNILCQSADRLRAIVYPNTYRMRTKVYIIGFTIAIIVYAGLSSIPRIVRVSLVDGSCRTKAIHINAYLFAAIECFLRYGIPTSIFIPINVAVIRKLCHLQVSNFSTVTHTSETTGVRKAPDSLTSLQISFFINTLCIIIEMTLIECTFVILVVLNIRGILRYDAGAIVRLYFLCSMVLVDSLNPILSILTIKALRNVTKNHVLWFYRFCQNSRRIVNPH